MPDPDVALDKLYKYILGAANPPGAASASGDIGQLIKYLVANPSAPTFRRQVTDGGIANNLHSRPLLYGVAYGGSALISNGPATVDGTSTNVWDSTRKAWRIGNTTGGVWQARAALSPIPAPGGPFSGSPFPPDFDLDGGLVGLVPDAAHDILTLEVVGMADAFAARADQRGIGWGTNTSSIFGAGTRYVQAWRHSTNGWTLSTNDGSTASDQAEASDTSDGNVHVWRLEWEEGAARFYVDGTLKITKTTNIPNPGSTGGNGHSAAGLGGSASGDATNSARLYAYAAYFK